MGQVGGSPEVSIVIPTYQKLPLLRKCLDSIQEYTDLGRAEVIVVSNGCTDGTPEYLEGLPQPFRHIIHKEALGYTKATNLGIRSATGQYVVLLNNDTVILPQPRHLWIDLLMAPFKGNSRVGISGPVKFKWDCAGVRRTALAFWCVMVRHDLFEKLGLLDEVFSPGMGEDADFSVRAELAGYALIQVPRDGAEEFGKGIPNQTFPIYHAGAATFGDRSLLGETEYRSVADRNTKILEERYGRKGDRLEELYGIYLNHPSDLNALFPVLRKYAEECRHITEFGIRGVFSTWAFLAARPARMIGYDVEYNANLEEAKDESHRAGVDFRFVKADVLRADIEPTDLLFIDTKHTYAQLSAELGRHGMQVRKYILIHDVESFGRVGEDGGVGELRAIEEWLSVHPEWTVREHLTHSNGLMVLERGAGAHSPPPKDTYATGWLPQPGTLAPDVSVVIPTAGHRWEEVLKPCLEAVIAYTPAQTEIIVVANGCPPEALVWLATGQKRSVRILVFPDRIGYIRAVNAGIATAAGEYVVTLDDDSFLQPQETDQWIRTLKAPFLKDPTVGATGPFASSYPDLGQVLHSGCTMYRKRDLLALSPPFFDETFNPGYLGDEDLALRLRKAGKRLVEVPEGHKAPYVDGFFQIAFPVVHMGTVNTMPKNTTDLPLVVRNRKILLERHADLVHENQHGAYMREAGPVGIPGTVGRPKVSVIIPTYKDNWRVEESTGQRVNLLKRNLKTLAQYTDLVEQNIEVIVVTNGCVDGQEEHVKSLGAPFRVVAFQDPLGYTRATNEGIKVAEGEFLIFLNDDVELLPQPKNQWLEWLLDPFLRDPKMGVTGPLQLHDEYAGQDAIIGFCLCVRRSAMREAMAETNGLLDEIYSPGGGEDIDLCCRMRQKGYGVRQVPREGKLGFSHTNTGEFMIYHVNNQTFKDIPEYTNWIVKRNGAINMKRHNRDIRLNLGSGGVFYKGYLAVDLLDRRADVIADATALDLQDGVVSEILAIHLFEHLSPYKAEDALREWLRVLKPGGRLVMEMPNIEDLCKRFLATTDFQARWDALNAMYAPVNTTGEGEPTDITSPHLYGYWPADLENRLVRLGFSDVRFGPEAFPHPYPPNLHVEATKRGIYSGPPREEMSMAGLWSLDAEKPFPFGDDTTYAKAAAFLGECSIVEDWGCGAAWFKKFMGERRCIGIDASPSRHCDIVEDLRTRRSTPGGILLRHVIEHNHGWKKILENAVASFQERLVLVVFTPFGPETKPIATQWANIPDISFKKEDLTACFKGLHFTEEHVKSDTQHGEETIFYVSKGPA